MSSDQIHAIILTMNEEKHLARCLESVRADCASVTVIDCGSTDATLDIARRYGAEILANPWENYAAQLNFGIRALAGRGGWLMRLDADEVLASAPGSMRAACGGARPDVDGLLVRRRLHFYGQAMRWGGMDPIWQLRLWREGRGYCEQRWMDEHIVVQAKVAKSPVRIDDINLNSLTWWTQKHNGYASREAIDILARRHGVSDIQHVARAGGIDQVIVKRALKDHLYLRLGGGARALIYFLYRYIFRLGFLDGRAGWYFHVLQGFWYRTLVDAKILEIEQHAREHGVPLSEAVYACTGIALQAPPPQSKAAE